MRSRFILINGPSLRNQVYKGYPLRDLPPMSEFERRSEKLREKQEVLDGGSEATEKTILSEVGTIISEVLGDQEVEVEVTDNGTFIGSLYNKPDTLLDERTRDPLVLVDFALLQLGV